MITSELIRQALLRGGRRPTVGGQSGTSRRRGDGYEFAELRSYVSGDDPRRIDWAATARAGSLQTRVVLEEHALILAVIVDDSASMHLGRERSRLVEAQASMHIWYSCAQTGDRCLRIGSAELAPSIHTSCPTPELAAALRTATAILPPGSALLVISDMHATLDPEAVMVLGARHDCTFLLARDPWHAGLPLRGLVRLEDSENGSQRVVFIDTQAAQKYVAAVQAREAELEARFTAAGWRWGLLDGDPEAALRAAFVPSRWQP